MPVVTRFQDLITWQRARLLTRAVYEVTRQDRFARDYGLSSQMQRSAVSVMANIAEGFERGRPAEFHQFLSMAKASCAELRSHLFVAHDIGYLDDVTFERLMATAEDVSRLAGALRARVEARLRSRPRAHSALSTQHSALSDARP